MYYFEGPVPGNIDMEQNQENKQNIERSTAIFCKEILVIYIEIKIVSWIGKGKGKLIALFKQH